MQPRALMVVLFCCCSLYAEVLLFGLDELLQTAVKVTYPKMGSGDDLSVYNVGTSERGKCREVYRHSGHELCTDDFQAELSCFLLHPCIAAIKPFASLPSFFFDLSYPMKLHMCQALCVARAHWSVCTENLYTKSWNRAVYRLYLRLFINLEKVPRARYIRSLACLVSRILIAPMTHLDKSRKNAETRLNLLILLGSFGWFERFVRARG